MIPVTTAMAIFTLLTQVEVAVDIVRPNEARLGLLIPKDCNLNNSSSTLTAGSLNMSNDAQFHWKWSVSAGIFMAISE